MIYLTFFFDDNYVVMNVDDDDDLFNSRYSFQNRNIHKIIEWSYFMRSFYSIMDDYHNHQSFLMLFNLKLNINLCFISSQFTWFHSVSVPTLIKKKWPFQSNRILEAKKLDSLVPPHSISISNFRDAFLTF